MNPAGKLGSVRTLPSTLIRRCITILVTSVLVRAYFSLLRRKITNGSDSRSLCGPWDGRGANTPPNLSNIHALGAARRFKCFLGPRAYENNRKIEVRFVGPPQHNPVFRAVHRSCTAVATASALRGVTRALQWGGHLSRTAT